MRADRPLADIAVIGGSGFYSFLDDAESVAVSTPYGDPSAPVSVGSVAGRSVAFLPRHGPHHELPPHAINYRANAWALRSLGVRQVLAPCAVGGLRSEVAPGDVVVPDQLVDRTQRPRPVLRGDRRGAPAVRGPLLRAAAPRGDGRGRHDPRRRHDGGDRGPALLHPGRVGALRRPGLDAGQHDRSPGGGAGAGAAAVLRGDRAGDRHGRRRRGGPRESARRRSSPGSRPTSTGCAACCAT